MKVVSQDALTKLIQLSKDNFIDKNDTVQATTVPLATVATTGDYDDLTNKPEEIPAQSGQSGKFLTTNGTSVSWATVNALPSQTSQSGKFLTTNGTSASWASIPTEIPSQSGNSGKFLTTNGSAVSWATVNALPSQTGQSGKFLTTNGTTASWAESSGSTITYWVDD